MAITGTLLALLVSCVEPADEGEPSASPTTSPEASDPEDPTPGDGPDAEGNGPAEVEGDPDAPIPTPDSAPEDPADLVAAIEEAVLVRGTADYEATATLGGIRRATVTGSYAFHAKDQIDFTADLDMRNRAGEDQSAEAVAVGEYFFLRPPTREGMPEGTEWIRRTREDFEDPPEPRALYSEAIRSLAGLRDWSMIAGASELLPAGGRNIDGVRARGYRATVAVLDGMDHVGGTGGAWRVLQDLYAQGVREVTFTVWIDDEYLPLAVFGQMDTDEGRGMVDLTFSDWGTTVEFPRPAGEVVWDRT